MLEGFTWFKQAGYRWEGDGITLYIDPWDVPGEPRPADVVFITHAHFDHYSTADIERIRSDGTVFVAPRDVATELSGDVRAVAPGDTVEAKGVKAQVVPAYNVVEERLGYHPKSNGWVGYVLDLGGRDYYHAGDTDDLPELERLTTDVAFLPIGGTFTMEAPEAAALARAISPKLAVPMHYGFVCGSPADAERFRAEAAPVPVEILSPQLEFEQA